MPTAPDRFAAFDVLAGLYWYASRDKVGQTTVFPFGMLYSNCIPSNTTFEGMREPTCSSEFWVAIVYVDNDAVSGRKDWLVVTIVIIDTRIGVRRTTSTVLVGDHKIVGIALSGRKPRVGIFLYWTPV
jgi:hypothetical protein